MKSNDILMQPITDLMWTAEEENDLNSIKNAHELQMKVNCGGTSSSCCFACCCDIPSIITKWLCN